MISQDKIDTVLQDAEKAVDTLSADVDRLAQSGDNPPAASSRTEAPADKTADASPTPSKRVSAAEPRIPARLRRLLSLRVTVSVQLAQRRMPLSEILKIVPGTILEFSRTVDQELDLMIGKHCIGQGAAVKLNEHFGLRINGIGDVRDRLATMTGS